MIHTFAKKTYELLLKLKESDLPTRFTHFQIYELHDSQKKVELERLSPLVLMSYSRKKGGGGGSGHTFLTPPPLKVLGFLLYP